LRKHNQDHSHQTFILQVVDCDIPLFGRISVAALGIDLGIRQLTAIYIFILLRGNCRNQAPDRRDTVTLEYLRVTLSTRSQYNTLRRRYLDTLILRGVDSPSLGTY